MAKIDLTIEQSIHYIEVNAVLNTTVNKESKTSTHFLTNIKVEDFERMIELLGKEKEGAK